jgi:hypothetical protein
MRASLGYLGVLSLLLVTGCDFGNCLDCNRAQPFPLFEDSVELNTPSSAVAGDTFTVSVRAHPRVSGTGHVRLVSQTHLLHTIAPVQDSTGCFRAESPSLCSGVSLATDSARVAVNKDRTLTQTWRLVLEEGPARGSDPLVSAVVEVDSVRSQSGPLYSVHSRKGPDVVQEMHESAGVLVFRTSSSPVAIPLRNGG